MKTTIIGEENKNYYVIVDTRGKTPKYLYILTKADGTDLFIKVDSLFDATMFNSAYEAQKSMDIYNKKRENVGGVYWVKVSASLKFEYGPGVW